jgi:hypothetical protein
MQQQNARAADVQMAMKKAECKQKSVSVRFILTTMQLIFIRKISCRKFTCLKEKKEQMVH